MTLLDERLRQMQRAIDREVERAMFEPEQPDSTFSRNIATIDKYLRDERALLSGRPVTLPDGNVAVRLPIPYDACAVFRPLTLAELIKDLQ